MGKLVDKNLYLVVPKIIVQPTWGGDYILDLKKWRRKAPFAGHRIGQSYELYSGSWLRSDIACSADPDFTGELSFAGERGKIIYRGKPSRLIAMEYLVKNDPLGALGRTAVKKSGGKMNLLIKLNQSCGNSFQIHIGKRVKSIKWRAKQECWYFLKPGLVTLGLKPGVKKEDFRAAMHLINGELQKLSADVVSGSLDLKKAKCQALRLIKASNPWKYVNLLALRTNEVVDLSQGGLHHSWEDDPQRFPLGNIVYELQDDVMDPISTIRCFDKGKFKDDGSLRKLDIDEYFRYLNTDPGYNRPNRHRRMPKLVRDGKTLKIESLMSNSYCRLDRLTLKDTYDGRHSKTDNASFHHLFASRGSFRIDSGRESLTVTPGHSCFICASAGSYRLTPLKETRQEKIEILKSYIS